MCRVDTGWVDNDQLDTGGVFLFTTLGLGFLESYTEINSYPNNIYDSPFHYSMTSRHRGVKGISCVPLFRHNTVPVSNSTT